MIHSYIVGPTKSKVKKIIFAQVGGYFTHYLLENKDIIYRGYTAFKKLSGNKYPWRLAIGNLVEYQPTVVYQMGQGRGVPAIEKTNC